MQELYKLRLFRGLSEFHFAAHGEEWQDETVIKYTDEEEKYIEDGLAILDMAQKLDIDPREGHTAVKKMMYVLNTGKHPPVLGTSTNRRVTFENDELDTWSISWHKLSLSDQRALVRVEYDSAAASIQSVARGMLERIKPAIITHKLGSSAVGEELPKMEFLG